MNTPGLCLDSGEFIPAAELNRRIDMVGLTNQEMQALREKGKNAWTAADEILKLREKVAKLEAQPASGQKPVSASPMNKRRVSDAIRCAYDCGYNDARNAKSIPGDSAPGYKGRDVEADHGGALINALYPAPAQQPLSDERIFKAYTHATGMQLPNMGRSRGDLLLIARAIEAEHGIKEKP
jgi:hypothetical protein